MGRAEVVKIEPKHGRYAICQAEDGNWVFMVGVSPEEAEGPYPTSSHEEVKYITGFVIHNSNHARLVGNLFLKASAEMEKQEEYHIGDEVANVTDPSKRFFVTHIGKDFISGVSERGGVYKTKPMSTWKKTGKWNKKLVEAFLSTPGTEEE